MDELHIRISDKILSIHAPFTHVPRIGEHLTIPKSALGNPSEVVYVVKDVVSVVLGNSIAKIYVDVEPTR